MAVANKKIVLFYGTADIYSQFHPCKFYVDGFAYNCAEQYMMHQKAILFKDDDMAEKIMKESIPKIIKSYGRKVKILTKIPGRSTAGNSFTMAISLNLAKVRNLRINC